MYIKYEVGSLDELLIVDAQIPEFAVRNTREKIASRIKHCDALILIAKIADTPIAYKIGYALSSTTFYSWLGGVIPAYRQQGVATRLRQQQECWAINAGYRHITVKSMNRFPAMLQLLISSGYQISAYQDNGSPSASKICFIKDLLDDTKCS